MAALAALPVAGTLIYGAATTLKHAPLATGTLSPAAAARFLTQATFGPSDASIATVRSQGYSAWIAKQEAIQSSPSTSNYVQQWALSWSPTNPDTVPINSTVVYNGIWKGAITNNDQLRERIRLALSEIFVISFNTPLMKARSAASYYDMLGADAFGNFRTLLQDVTLHPAMGVYLNMMSNVKENTSTGQHPDQNYAREVMQLMSIGLNQLHQDGSPVTDANGRPVPAFSATDVSGLASVFTGYGWYTSNPNAVGTLPAFSGVNKPIEGWLNPMQPYPAYHSTLQKTFLGVTVAASTNSNPPGDLKIALDTIFNHPNVGPFIGKQLIQRLVTSNPSPAYVSRVAGVFNNNGKGVRGDMAAVIAAILLDPEARNDGVGSDPGLGPTFGKLREPVVRMANWARAFGANSSSGWWSIGDTSAPTAMNQITLDAPSVFNFWSPTYIPPPATALGHAGLFAPEFQAVNAVSTAGYLNVMLRTAYRGAGTNNNQTGIPDVSTTYPTLTPLAANPSALANKVSLMLLYGQMSTALRTRIMRAVNTVNIPGPPATTAQINTALEQRVDFAVYFALASPEYLVQR